MLGLKMFQEPHPYAHIVLLAHHFQIHSARAPALARAHAKINESLEQAALSGKCIILSSKKYFLCQLFLKNI